MPGPRSAPNGNVFLTVRSGDSGPNIITGKSAFKRGEIKRKKAVDEANRKARAKQNDN